MTNRSQRKKLVVIVILLVILLLVGFVQFRDKILTSASSIAADHQSDAPAADGNVPMTFEAWRSPIPEIGWQKPEAVKLLARDPMALDLSTVKIEIAKPRVRTYNNATKANTIGLISIGGTVLHVKGIVFSKEAASSIIIEEKVLHEGDSILGAVITRIFEHSVEFEKDGKRWIVDIGEPSKKE